MNCTTFIFSVFGLLAFASSTSASVAPAELPDLVEKVLPGVVNISSTTVVNYADPWQDFLRGWGIPSERRQTSLGSGFLIDQDGMIITNNHVIDRATEVVVVLHDKRQFKARLIGRDPKMDLALIQIRDEQKKVPQKLISLPLADSDKVRIGEPVFAVGNPFGLQHTVTMGIISAKHRTIGLGPFDNFLQTDASINPGNSGGPLFNLKGEVIGINTAIKSHTGQSGGLGFATPVNELKAVLADLKKYGRVVRPWLGIFAERITPQLANYYRLPTDRGVIVYNLVQDAPALEAGMRQGDIIIGVGTQEVSEPGDLERALAKQKPGESMILKVRRGKRTIDIRLNLEEFPRLDRIPEGII